MLRDLDHQLQAVHQCQHHGVVLDYPVRGQLAVAPQLGAVLGIQLGEALEDPWLGPHSLDHEVTDVLDLGLHDRISGPAAFLGDRWLEEGQAENPADDRFVTNDNGVLCNHDRGAERRLVRVVAVGLDATGPQGAAAIEVLELIPLEGLGVVLVGVPVGLEQHQGQVGHLAHGPAQARERALCRVEALVHTAEQLPQELDQCGLARVGLA